MKRRKFAPVPDPQEAGAAAPPPSSAGSRPNKLAVPMLLPSFSNAKRADEAEPIGQDDSTVQGSDPSVSPGEPSLVGTEPHDSHLQSAAAQSTLATTEQEVGHVERGRSDAEVPLPQASAVEHSSTDTVQTYRHPLPTPTQDFYFVELDATLIDQNSHPPRSLYLDDGIRVIADSMRADGQRDAIHVIPNPAKPNRYIIGDGWTRVLATRSYNLNNGVLLAKVHTNLSEEQASWLGYSQNKDRNGATDYDLGVYYQGWNASGMDWEEIATRAGVSKAQMTYYAAFSKLESDVLSLVKATPQRFSANVAYHLSRLQAQAGVSVAANLANKFLTNEQTIKWLKEQVDDALAKLGRQGRKRNDSNTVMFQRRFSVGHYRQRKNGQVEMAIQIPDTSRVAEFNQAIESLLKQYLDPKDLPDGGPTGATPPGDAPE